MTNTLHLSRMLHIADSAFPIGGYAYSYGLEYAVKSGIIASIDGLRRYLREYSKQMTHFDLAFVVEAYQLDYNKKLTNLSEMYNIMLLNNKIKQSGEIVGRNWIRLMSSIYPELDSQLSNKHCFDFLLVYGRSCKMIGLSLKDTIEMFLYMTIRDQISAAIRLGTIGPTLAHEIQHNILEQTIDHLNNITIPPVNEAYKTTYILELSQLAHKNLYTRLFQN